ncbi:hypothetical protein MMC07_008986 [Pseudocyphellaria aurata]|nr:hypothetical protein [Pseudocyphellaria aurata]
MSNILKLHGGKILAGGGVVAGNISFPLAFSHILPPFLHNNSQNLKAPIKIGAYFFLKPESSMSSLFRTQGVKNIEDRYSSGGGSKHHTPGAGTMRGNSEDVAPRADPGNDKSGMGSKEWRERIGDQTPEVSSAPGRGEIGRSAADFSSLRLQPSNFDKAWNKTHYGTEKGK